MNNFNNKELIQELKHLQITNASLLSAIPLIHVVGYGLLTLALLNIVGIIIPTHVLDPNWLLETLEQLIEIIPVTLIALVFVFYGKDLYRDRQERRILKIIHFFSFCYGILFLLIIPVAIVDTTKIYKASNWELIDLVMISIKSNIGALVSGILLIKIWQRNKWIKL